MKRGLLLTMTEPPAAMEEEFNAWYETEHLPERLAIAGFRSARRWVAPVAPGEYETELSELPRGHWHVVIEDPRGAWRIAKEAS